MIEELYEFIRIPLYQNLILEIYPVIGNFILLKIAWSEAEISVTYIYYLLNLKIWYALITAHKIFISLCLYIYIYIYIYIWKSSMKWHKKS